MPPRISDRYTLELRLGRDGDLEEWLATDTSLERPVLIRALGPESSSRRRDEFVAAVSAAAKSAHPHLGKIFAVDKVEGGAYSVSEWPGGATLSDRVAAGTVMELDEFLPNAAGLAGALAELHRSGATHGNIDTSAVAYSVAHPAKLIGFGRSGTANADHDVRALAGVLETAATGRPPGGAPPSESIDGFPRRLDRILRHGQSGRLTAEELNKLLLGTRTPHGPRPEPRSTSRRVLIVALSLVVVAVGLVALGRLFSEGGELLPVAPEASTPTSSPPPSTTTTIVPEVDTLVAASFDPYGEGGENDQDVPNLIDGSTRTRWQTERYQAPLTEVKPGVGVRFSVQGSPSAVSLLGLTSGTGFEVHWSAAVSPQLEDWERILRGLAPEGPISFTLPTRVDGHWLLWLTDLPPHPDGGFYSSIAEVRFSP